MDQVPEVDLSSRLKKSYFKPESLVGIGMTCLAGLCLLLTLIPLGAVLSYVVIKGAGSFRFSLFTELPPPPLVPGGGFANALIGTVVMLVIATAISVPIGVFAAVYLSEFGSGILIPTIRFAANILTGVPSIIVGIFVYSILVLTTKTFSAIAGGVALSILMIPVILRTTDEALKIVPQQIRWASFGVGASNYQTILKVVLPAAMPSIVTGVTLAIARAAGETAPLLFTALFSQFWIKGLLEPTPSLAVLIFNFAIVPFKNQTELAWAASFVLVLLVLCSSIASRLATQRKVY